MTRSDLKKLIVRKIKVFLAITDKSTLTVDELAAIVASVVNRSNEAKVA